MRLGIKIGDVMTRGYVSIKPTTKVTECAKYMVKEKIGSLIVQEGAKLKGIITEKDIIRAISKKKNLSEIAAKDIMTRWLTTIKPEKDMYDALVLMKKRKIRWLPVVEGSKIIGLLTMKDILKIEPSLFDTIFETERIKEEKEKLKAAGIGRKALEERKRLSAEIPWVREGSCDECEAYGILYNIDGQLLCEECRNEQEE